MVTFFSAENAKPSAVFALTISLKLFSVAGYVDAFMIPLYKPFSTVGVRGPPPSPINSYPQAASVAPSGKVKLNL